MKTLLTMMIAFNSLATWALEVDEKLTLRILKRSESAKTILINRGIEDGLAEGDHAKFFLAEGVVARGVLIKASPARSVWSVYRLVNADFIKADQVMNLKITPPVKITKDESQMLVKEDKPTLVSTDPRDLGIPLAQGAEDLDQMEVDNANKSTTSVNEMAKPIFDKNLEIVLMGSFYQARSVLKGSSGANSFSRDENNTKTVLGGEYYFKDPEKWYAKISLMGFLGFGRYTAMASQGTSVSENSTEFGGTLSIYPGHLPGESFHFIPYFYGSLSMGVAGASYSPGTENINGDTVSLNSNFVSYALGGGYKYFLSNGMGARLSLEYFGRTDQFAKDDNNISWQKSRTGIQAAMGLSYRF